mmetsp:Transcript_10499/g.11244  ORF Transcript_10499/g.11244 Transcript_10499/m.11244 type:complete len:445 (+) Transcript_10499:36-1370(+)
MVPFKFKHARNNRITKKIHRWIRHPFYACFVLVFISVLSLNIFQMFHFVGLSDRKRVIEHDDSPMQLRQQLLHVDNGRRNIKRAIFYNIFIPKDDQSRKKYALDLVEEQLQYYNAASDFIRSVPIYYTLIGDTNSAKDVDRICATAGKCHLLRSTENGDEGLTLESLYDYCSSNPKSQVTYLHNKGSFHPSPQNTALRRMLTKSIFSDECQLMPVDSCTVCSARFAPLPHTHMVGNSWVAECLYIKDLIHPLQFSRKMDEMIEHSLHLNDETLFPMPHPKFADRPHDYGLKRFSFEHWIGSHPRLKPCDVFPHFSYKYGFLGIETLTSTENTNSRSWSDHGSYKKGNNDGNNVNPTTYNDWKPELRQVPWISLDGFWHWSFTEWMCGRGRLSQYKFLYDMYPDADSFIWTYYKKPLKISFQNFYSLFNRGCPVPINKLNYLENK